MKRVITILIFQFVFVTVALPQQNREGKLKVISIPARSVVIFVAVQPDCPLEFESVELFVSEDGEKPILRYVLKNGSAKAIRYFSLSFYNKYTIKEWGKYGISTGLTVGREDGSGPNLLFHNDLFESLNQKDFQIIPVNKRVEDLLQSSNGDGLTRIAYFGLIKKIVFEDGSTFVENRDLTDLF